MEQEQVLQRVTQEINKLKNSTENTRVYVGNERERFLLGERRRKGNNILICIGINPSKANKENNDRTINRIIKIVDENNFDGWIMINLCHIVTPYPSELKVKIEDETYSNIVNEKSINIILNEYNNATILAMWGRNINKYEILKENWKAIKNKCKYSVIDINKDGTPMHPNSRFKKVNTKLKRVNIIEPINNNEFKMKLSVNSLGFKLWTMRNLDMVKILKPAKLVSEIKKVIEDANKRYDSQYII